MEDGSISAWTWIRVDATRGRAHLARPVGKGWTTICQNKFHYAILVTLEYATEDPPPVAIRCKRCAAILKRRV